MGANHLYKNGIKVVTKFITSRYFGKYIRYKQFFYNLFNEYVVYIDTNNEVRITELSDTYHFAREKYENYTRTRTTDETSIDFNLLYYDRRDNIRIEMPRPINFGIIAENEFIEDTFVNRRVSNNVLSAFRAIMPLVSAYLPTFKIFVKRADESMEALYYEKNNDCTKIAIATSRYGYPSEASINYTCTIRNEIIDANSMKRVIETTNGYATISLTVVGYDIKEITNETKLITHLFSYFMTRDEYRYTFDALWNDIVNNSFQDPPNNFTLVKLSESVGEKTILEKEWHNYTYNKNQDKNKPGHLTRARRIPKDTNHEKK